MVGYPLGTVYPVSLLMIAQVVHPSELVNRPRAGRALHRASGFEWDLGLV